MLLSYAYSHVNYIYDIYRYFEEVKNADDALIKTKVDKQEEEQGHVAKMASLGVAQDPNHFQGFTFERPKKTKTNVNDLFGGQ